MSTHTSPPPIEVFLQPPSPALGPYTLPPVSALLPPIKSMSDLSDSAVTPCSAAKDDTVLPSIRLAPRWSRKYLDALEPRPTLTISTSSLSPCSSPGLSPLSDFSPLDLSDPYRRVRSLSNASNTPLTPHLDDRCLSEPPPFLLPSLLSPAPSPSGSPKPSAASTTTVPAPATSVTMTTTPSVTTEAASHTSSCPPVSPWMHAKRRRGRPPNTRTQRDSSGWTFVTPTVWQVKQSSIPQTTSSASASSFTWSATDSTDAGHKSSSDANHATFTTTAMDIALTIPRKKRGRKPKVQLVGNSCFVWKDLTARRRSKKKLPLAGTQHN